jgi:hypothetical protein
METHPCPKGVPRDGKVKVKNEQAGGAGLV